MVAAGHCSMRATSVSHLDAISGGDRWRSFRLDVLCGDDWDLKMCDFNFPLEACFGRTARLRCAFST
eukprot:800051-Pleurochrysis_carterae.AAC.1